jgi:hypothetical protein
MEAVKFYLLRWQLPGQHHTVGQLLEDHQMAGVRHSRRLTQALRLGA